MGRWEPGLDGYVHGPAAAAQATRLALERVPDPSVMALVEGVSDQIALDTLATLRGLDLLGARIAVVPIGGAQAVARFVREHTAVPTVAMCDAAEYEWFARVLPSDLIAVCRADLEDELIRGLGVDAVLAVLEANGDRRRYTTLTKQAAWQGRDPGQQLRRFVGAGARRKLRYARALVNAAVAVDRVPAPIEAVLSCAWRAAGSPPARPGPAADHC